jgi:hypothetical protein
VRWRYRAPGFAAGAIVAALGAAAVLALLVASRSKLAT